MVREFTLPDVGEGVAEGELVSWLVEPGDTVGEDQPVAEVETDKALVEVPSPVNGTVRELHWEEGDVVPVGDLFITYDVGSEAQRASENASGENTSGETASKDEAQRASENASGETASKDETQRASENASGETASKDETQRASENGSGETASGETASEGEKPQGDELPEPGSGGGAEADTTSEAETAADAEAGRPGATGAESEAVATPTGRVFAPPHVRRLAREEGVDLASIESSGPGGRITEGDVRAAAEGGAASAAGQSTGTAAESESASATGARTGESASATGARTGESAGSSGGIDAAEATGETTPERPAASAEAADRERTLAAPATRRLAQEEGVDIDAVSPTEERDGEAFVTPEAVREYAEAQRRAQEADREAIEAGEPVAETGADFAEGERERREPFSGVRKRIAEAMVESAYSAPHVTHHDEVDVTELVEIREKLKPVAEERGIRLTYVPFVVKAVVAALKEYPEMNAVIDEENEEVVYRDYYDVGVATATDVGLMVPVVDDADRKGLLQLSSEMNELVQKARERTISPGELRGSTFTITNVGGIGGEYATPILNYPETGILAMGEIKRKPRVVTDEDAVEHNSTSPPSHAQGDGEESIEPRSVMTLSLSFDHRLIDGAVGARFTNEVMTYLENPSLLLLE